MTEPTAAFDAAKTAATEEPLGFMDYDGEQYPIVKRPNGLLLAELTRLDSDDPEAGGALVEFFQETLGREGYRKFKRAFYAQDFETTEASVEALALLMQSVVETTMGRPTK